MRRIGSVLAGLAFAVFGVGVVLFILERPWFTALQSTRHSLVPDATARVQAEVARAFVVAGDATARATLIRLMPADAVAHLDDVRRVMTAVSLMTLLLGVALVLWVGFWARHRPHELAFSLFTASALLAGFVLLAGATATSDFDTFFSAFHGVFFAEGTWTFPSDSLLIRLFPETFWVAAGVALGVGVVGMAAVYGAAGWFIGRRGAGKTSLT